MFLAGRPSLRPAPQERQADEDEIAETEAREGGTSDLVPKRKKRTLQKVERKRVLEICKDPDLVSLLVL